MTNGNEKSSVHIPVPDPTVLTSQVVQREIANLRDIIETRLDGMDKVLVSMQDEIDTRHEAIVSEVTNLQKLQDAKGLAVTEKFISVATQFNERDVRSDKTAELNQKALDAALLTAEKAVTKQQESFTVATTKSELSFTKQIEALGVQLTAIVKTNDDKVSDLRQSIGRLDNAVASSVSRANGHGDMVAYIIAGISVIGLILTLVVHFGR